MALCKYCGCYTGVEDECELCFSDRFITYVSPQSFKIEERMADMDELNRRLLQEQEIKRHQRVA